MAIRLKQAALLVVTALMLGLMLAACGDDAQAPASDSGSNEIASEAQNPTADPSSLPEDPSSAATMPVDSLPNPATEESDSGEIPELGFALGDPNFRASDPSTVILASGQIQFIEFFAFW